MKPAATFRNYDEPARDTVREFYRQNHAHQTLDFVLQKKADYLRLARKKMTVWEALDYLNTLVDDSDPDVDFTQIDHALQTAEAVRQAGQPRWLIAAGLIHDLGKVLCLFGEPQWAVVGDTFPVGCAFSDRAVYPEYFALNPDSTHPIYSTENGIYESQLRARPRPHVVGSRRVHLPRREGLPADRGAVRAAVPLVLPVAQGRRVPASRQRSRSRRCSRG